MSVDLDAAKKYISTVSGRLAEISAQSVPNHKNTANGYFHDDFLNDPVIGDLLPKPPDYDLNDSEGHHTYSIVEMFHAELLMAFKNNPNYKTDWTESITLAWEARSILSDVGDIVLNIVKLIFDEATVVGVVDSIKKDIQSIVDKVDSTDIGYEGTYPTGWLAPAVNTVAQKYHDLIAAEQWGPEATKILGPLRQACQALLTLSTGDHTPWLKAEWQIKFQGIMMGLNRATA